MMAGTDRPIKPVPRPGPAGHSREPLTARAATWYKHTMFAFFVTLGVFGLILILARLRAPLASAILAGTVVIGLLFGFRAGELLRVVWAGATDLMTIGVVVIIVILLTLSHVLRDSGRLERIVHLAGAVFRRRAVAIAALPALIGLLPMPGGALFSAPMVHSAAGRTEQEGARLSAINYWFRHIWEHWWPLYPGVLVAMSVTRSDLGVWVAFQIPLGVFMAASGLLLFRGVHPGLHVTGPRPAPGTKRKLLRATAPIWIVVGVWAVVRVAVWPVPAAAVSGELRDVLQKIVPILLGLLVSLAYTVRTAGLAPRTVGRLLGSGSVWTLAVLVISVMVFKTMFERVEVAPRIAQELADFRVPPVLIVAALPFIAGIVTGLAFAFVGISFPIVIGLVEALSGAAPLRPYIVLAFAFGHLGMMLSPLHLCHILSNRYFQTDFGATCRRLLAPAAAFGVLAAAYFAVLKFFMA